MTTTGATGKDISVFTADISRFNTFDNSLGYCSSDKVPDRFHRNAGITAHNNLKDRADKKASNGEAVVSKDEDMIGLEEIGNSINNEENNNNEFSFRIC